VEGDGLGVIAGAGGDDSATALFVREGEYLVKRATFLKGSRALQVVEFQEDFLAGHLGEGGGVGCGREIEMAADAFAGGADRVECDGHDLSLSTITCK